MMSERRYKRSSLAQAERDEFPDEKGSNDSPGFDRAGGGAAVYLRAVDTDVKVVLRLDPQSSPAFSKRRERPRRQGTRM